MDRPPRRRGCWRCFPPPAPACARPAPRGAFPLRPAGTSRCTRSSAARPCRNKYSFCRRCKSIILTMHAMPVMIVVLCLLAIAYRFYSAFLAAKVAVLDGMRPTPAMQLNDGQNYHPTSKWVLFGHHFAAISGAGPLIGPVLAAQFGYLPGLLWIVIG